jgi:multisubunit Na+/H+ antiporter MnhG subunit
MELLNVVLIIIGAIITLIGIAVFLNPNFSKLINAPGGPKLKAIIAIVIGLIILFYGIIK